MHRQFRNVFDDVKTMERLGLVEKDTNGHFYVPWDWSENGDRSIFRSLAENRSVPDLFS
jgi:hypothetical protein